ncbi:MAG TPA: 2-dehydropantoate 2-reductase, partial [Symbiobacteriaceae bacterium]|nr:2-dehydropantoate 2-reductase [Symbiobacteriaceae bacterium]
MMRVGILGAGALGSLFAYYLRSRTSSEVWLLARSPVPERVTVDGVGSAPVGVIVGPPAQPVDLLVVMVKAYATVEAIRWAAGAVGPSTVALTLQNGLGNAEALAEAL